VETYNAATSAGRFSCSASAPASAGRPV